jgi:cob(I)alamin adenosyltransferase
MKGYLQVYTGDGKGKTTAAIGLAVRAAGAGLTVFIGQFIKAGGSSENRSLQRLSDRITLEHFGRGRFIKGRPAPADIAAALRGLKRVEQILRQAAHRIVVLDEGCTAVALGLISEAALLETIELAAADTEVVVTGRGASKGLIERADLVTEMKVIKHYFKDGVRARDGIER